MQPTGWKLRYYMTAVWFDKAKNVETTFALLSFLAQSVQPGVTEDMV